MRTYRCAICQRDVTNEGPLPHAFPFCSPRCRMVDLGQWLREDYALDRDLTPEELPNRRADPEARDAESGRRTAGGLSA